MRERRSRILLTLHPGYTSNSTISGLNFRPDTITRANDIGSLNLQFPGYGRDAFASVSISWSVGKRPSCFFENFSSPSIVISKTPPRDRT
jgi:hypothetical protein